MPAKKQKTKLSGEVVDAAGKRNGEKLDSHKRRYWEVEPANDPITPIPPWLGQPRWSIKMLVDEGRGYQRREFFVYADHGSAAVEVVVDWLSSHGAKWDLDGLPMIVGHWREGRLVAA